MSKPFELSAETCLVRSSKAVSTSMHDETVILDHLSGKYFGLTGVGARVWELLSASTTWSSMVTSITEEYAVERHRAERELRVLLEELAAKGLLVVGSARA